MSTGGCFSPSAAESQSWIASSGMTTQQDQQDREDQSRFGAQNLVRYQPDSRFRMVVEKVAQSHEKLRCVVYSTFVQRLADVVNNHGSDHFSTVRLFAQIAGERRCRYFGDMLVLGDREHFAFIEVAKSDAIFQRNHIHCSNRRMRLALAGIDSSQLR